MLLAHGMEHPAGMDPLVDDAARCDRYTSSDEWENRPVLTTDDWVDGKRPMAVEPSPPGAAPTGAVVGPVMGQGSISDSRAPKCRGLVRIIDDDDEEEEAAQNLVCRPCSRPDVTPGDDGRVAEDPPAAHVEEARPGGTEAATAARRARRRVFTAAHQISNLYVYQENFFFRGV